MAQHSNSMGAQQGSELLLKRVVLKLSGEALMGEQPGDNINKEMLTHFAMEIKDALSLGVQVALVLGAGNIVRGTAFAGEHKPARIQGDYMGMLATIINSMALQSKLHILGVKTKLQTALSMDQVAQIYIREKAISGLESGRAVIFAGGTGNPYFTTDTAAALRASEVNADALLKGTNVPGVYTNDPKVNKDSVMLEHTNFLNVITKDLRVMDATAVTMCRDQDIPIYVFDIHTPGNLRKLLEGSKIGTRIDAHG